MPLLSERLVGWLLREGSVIDRPDALVRAFAEELVSAGVPAERVWYGTLVLHPQMFARSWTWKRGEAEIDVGVLTHAMSRSDLHLNSPAAAVMGAQQMMRWRVDREGTLAFPAFHRLREAGMTEYVAMSMRSRGEPFGGVSVTTARASGFSDEEVAGLEAARPALALLLRSFLEADLTDTLLRTYLGRDAGERVRRGQIRRGDGETIPAALWFSDLRDFTGLSERLPREALLDLLNDWFGAAVPAVEGQQGSVLKFMGDGLLAVFTASEGEASRREACERALAAASAAAGRVAEVNQRREAEGLTPIRYGLALHIGDVMYGNIGSPDRLDFTVIGPAVNRAARMEPLSAQLGRTVVVSGDFARTAGGTFEPLGSFAVKGLAEPVEVFGLIRQLGSG